jgi:hypothetical protein
LAVSPSKTSIAGLNRAIKRNRDYFLTRREQLARVDEVIFSEAGRLCCVELRSETIKKKRNVPAGLLIHLVHEVGRYSPRDGEQY